MQYFSATKNTERVLKKFKEEFLTLGHEVDMYRIEDKCDIDFNAYDLLIVGYPIHGLNAPRNMLIWAKSLPILDKNLPCYIIKSSGEGLKVNDASSIKLIKKLKKKNITFYKEFHYLMPYNMIFRHSDFMAYNMDQAANNKVKVDIKDILDLNIKPITRNIFIRFIRFVVSIEHPGARIIGKFMMRVKKKKCIKCGLCIKSCPMNNISTNKKGDIKIHSNCLFCSRCAFYCPKNAISYGFMFNSWKVNGAYSFAPSDNKKSKHPNWCKKSYKKYFDTYLNK